MKIPLILNGEKKVFDVDPSDSLLSVLRKEKITSVKCGCQKGLCGNCMVLIENKPVPSCIVHMCVLRDAKVKTLEAVKTDPVYKDIMKGFSMANINLCGYCDAGKILTAYSILTEYYRPEVKIIYEAISSLDLCCTDSDTLVNGILYSIAEKHKREGRRNGN